ncbi:MAG TPA: hypothetical protein VNI61_01105 [Gemmatimonadales bacterium]|nr:hypothetical protein [Gemmatimonadales bacterium]
MRYGLLALILWSAGALPLAAQAHDHRHPHSHRGPGPHFIDAFFTENAYIERKLRPDLFYSSDGAAGRYTAQLEIEWAMHRNWSLIVHAPVHHWNPPGPTSETGLGDVSLGAKWAVVNDREAFILAGGADLELPTGDARRGLGAEHATAVPFLLSWVPFGPERRALLQTAAHLELPLEGAAEAHGEVGAALSYTTSAGVTPVVELLAQFPLAGGEPTSWRLAPEFRWEFAESWELGAAVRVSVGGRRDEDYRVVLGFIKHYPVPR